MGNYRNEIQPSGDNGQFAGAGQQQQFNSNLYESGYPGAPGRSSSQYGQTEGGNFMPANFVPGNSNFNTGDGGTAGNGNFNNGGDNENVGGNGQPAHGRKHHGGHGHKHGQGGDNGNFNGGDNENVSANGQPAHGKKHHGHGGHKKGSTDLTSTTVAGSNVSGGELATQGLTLLSQGDQYDGIMDLLGAEHLSPSSINNQTFLNQLQLVESNPNTGATTDLTNTGSLTNQGAPTDLTNTASLTNQGTPTDLTNPSLTNPGAPTDLTNTAATTASGQPDAGTVMAQKGLTDAQQDPTTGMLELMAASTMNPNLVSDQNFLQVLQQALPGAQTTDAQSNPAAQTTDTAYNPNATQQTDASTGQTVAPSNYTLPTQLTDTTNNPQSADPTIQTAMQQALTMISQGDQADAALLLMQVAQVDPQILQDKVFVQNLQAAEQAGTSALQTAQTQPTSTNLAAGAGQTDPTQLALAQPTGSDTGAAV